jgi:hypothetical protein
VKKAKKKAKPAKPKQRRPIEVGDFVQFQYSQGTLCGTVTKTEGELLSVEARLPARPMSEWWTRQVGAPAVERWPHTPHAALVAFKMLRIWATRLVPEAR